METVIIELTPEQQSIVEPVIVKLADGEAVIAQVFIDGVRLRVLDAETARLVRAAIGAMPPGTGRRSAFGESVILEPPNDKLTSGALTAHETEK